MPLIDLPAAPTVSDSRMAMILGIIGGPLDVEHFGTGMYGINSFSFDAYLGNRVVSKYPFDPYDKIDRDLPFEERMAAICNITEDPTVPASYGVCDTPAQLVDKYPALLTCPEPLVASFTRITKADQSPTGGWRWHKWGPYVGDHTPQHEYLYDEDGIDEVWVYHLYEVTPEPS